MTEPVATVYPKNALQGRDDLDVITPDVAPTLDALFRVRVQRSFEKTAYTEFDEGSGQWRDYTWAEIAAEVKRWQAALEAEGLKKGDRIALRLKNCRHWVIFDQAALGLGLVVVPLYVADRPDNVNYVLENSDSKLLFVENLQAWQELREAGADKLPDLQRVVVRNANSGDDTRVESMEDWLDGANQELRQELTTPEDLASIVYTSGTTGHPKGVMLSHKNMLWNAYSGVRSVALLPSELMLSFLPLSHTLERTVGYYVPIMVGCGVAYARSIPELPEDLLTIRPTGIITVPRIFERVYSKIRTQLEEGPALKKRLFELTVEVGWRRFEYYQGRGAWRLSFLLWPILDALVAVKVRERLGGRLKVAVVGGAPVPPAVSRVFVGLGMTLLQGYGLTESSPSISINTVEQNIPSSIGLPVHDVEVRIGEHNELLARGPNIMLGYWKDEEATRAAVDQDGWLHTGDKAKIEDGFISIIGRIKDILVLANGEKVPPADMEAAIAEDPLFDQVLVIGEHMPYLTAVVVLNPRIWNEMAKQLAVEHDTEEVLSSEAVENALLERVRARIQTFPGYARIQRITATLEPWTVESGVLTPTLKIKRPQLLERFDDHIARMYEGHAIYKT